MRPPYWIFRCVSEHDSHRAVLVGPWPDLGGHEDHARCVGKRHRWDCATSGLSGDYRCDGECDGTTLLVEHTPPTGRSAVDRAHADYLDHARPRGGVEGNGRGSES